MDYEKNAIEILRIIGSNSGFTVADSGGKDSSVLTHIAMKAGCPFEVVHNHTTVDVPEDVRNILPTGKETGTLRKNGA